MHVHRHFSCFTFVAAVITGILSLKFATPIAPIKLIYLQKVVGQAGPENKQRLTITLCEQIGRFFWPNSCSVLLPLHKPSSLLSSSMASHKNDVRCLTDDWLSDSSSSVDRCFEVHTSFVPYKTISPHFHTLSLFSFFPTLILSLSLLYHVP